MMEGSTIVKAFSVISRNLVQRDVNLPLYFLSLSTTSALSSLYLVEFLLRLIPLKPAYEVGTISSLLARGYWNEEGAMSDHSTIILLMFSLLFLYLCIFASVIPLLYDMLITDFGVNAFGWVYAFICKRRSLEGAYVSFSLKFCIWYAGLWQIAELSSCIGAIF